MPNLSHSLQLEFPFQGQLCHCPRQPFILPRPPDQTRVVRFLHVRARESIFWRGEIPDQSQTSIPKKAAIFPILETPFSLLAKRRTAVLPPVSRVKRAVEVVCLPRWCVKTRAQSLCRAGTHPWWKGRQGSCPAPSPPVPACLGACQVPARC